MKHSGFADRLYYICYKLTLSQRTRNMKSEKQLKSKKRCGQQWGQQMFKICHSTCAKIWKYL